MEYVAIHVVYEIKGNEEYKEAVLKAVTDSQEKICGVSSMLKKALPVTWEIIFNKHCIFSNKESLQLEESNAI